MSRITLIQLFTDSNKSSETKVTSMNNKIIDQSMVDRWDKFDIKNSKMDRLIYFSKTAS